MTKCRLIAVTKPSIPECDSAEDLVAYCARVSNPGNQANKDTASKLIKYLVSNQHWSPLEMVHLVIEVETTRDIARQLLRHRSFSFQEFSQRYAEAMDFSSPREARLQDSKNRQNSIESSDEELALWWKYEQNKLLEDIDTLYTEALDRGIAKEQARAVLPEGLTTSRLYVSGTLRSWVHYCALRTGNGTQKEHKEIADLCWSIVCTEFPSIAELLDKSGLDKLVDEFAAEMKKKLKQKASEGRTGWDNSEDFSDEALWDSMLDHMHKGDPVDIANYAAFAFARSKNEAKN